MIVPDNVPTIAIATTHGSILGSDIEAAAAAWRWFLSSRWPALLPLITMSSTTRVEKLGRFLLRGLRIGASTVSIVELLRNDWSGGIAAGVAWLLFLQVERRLPPVSSDSEP